MLEEGGREMREAFEELRQLLKSWKRDFWGCFSQFSVRFKV